MTPALGIEGLTIAYGDARVVDDVSLVIAPGEILGLVGESGSGKSTLAFAALGLLPPAARRVAGRIAVAGQVPGTGAARVAYIPQEPGTAFNPTLTVGRQIDLVLRRRLPEPPRARRASTEAMLKRMGLADPARILASYPFQLSGGQIQRALIAQAFLLDPALILADEPTTALDVAVQADILALIETLAAERGAAVLFITHNLGVVWQLCPTVAVMHRGHIVERGLTRAVIRAPAEAYTRRLLAALPALTPPRARLPVGDAA